MPIWRRTRFFDIAMKVTNGSKIGRSQVEASVPKILECYSVGSHVLLMDHANRLLSSSSIPLPKFSRPNAPTRRHAKRPGKGYFSSTNSSWKTTGPILMAFLRVTIYLPCQNCLPIELVLIKLLSTNHARDGTDVIKLMRDFVNEIKTRVNVFCMHDGIWIRRLSLSWKQIHLHMYRPSLINNYHILSFFQLCKFHFPFINIVF